MSAVYSSQISNNVILLRVCFCCPGLSGMKFPALIQPVEFVVAVY